MDRGFEAFQWPAPRAKPWKQATQEDVNLSLTQYINDRIEQELDEEEDLDENSDFFDQQTSRIAGADRGGDVARERDWGVPSTIPTGSPSKTLRLRPVSSLPDKYQAIFKGFQYFNTVQTEVFLDLVQTDRHIILSAPTGGGKTVAFELAIVRMLDAAADSCPNAMRTKMIYMSPTKSLCGERFRDWKAKFEPLGVVCGELTGDSSGSAFDMSELRACNLIVTTPEKWDSVTRKWRDHKEMIQSVKLLMIDEVHLLSDPSRGHTLEAVVTRMKTIASTLRIVAVSATIPNAEDIAQWLGPRDSARCHLFGEEKRPVQLRKVVFGYPYREGTSSFKFEMNLSYKLSSLIATYSEDKPTLVFTNSRRSAQFTATTLLRDTRLPLGWRQKQQLQEAASLVADHKLRDCVVAGIGFHHAGLDSMDRRTIENLFLSGDLPILVSTSTLAMGVNLPAHLVIVKATFQNVSGAQQEYSESQVMQMMGRAGRPQFDTSATAIIMTTEQQRQKYESLVNGTQIVESSLHDHLIEHLNAEIVLHTITDVSLVMGWIRQTFMYVRVMKNPRHYRLPATLVAAAQIEDYLQDLCLRSLNALAHAELIVMGDYDLGPNDAGRAMARFYVAFETMKKFSTLKGDESLEDTLGVLSRSKEFDEIQLRRVEKVSLNALNKDKHKATVRFPFTGKIKDGPMKVSILMQAQLGCLQVADQTLLREAQRVMQIAQRLAKCLVEYLWAAKKNVFRALKSAVVLCKCLHCGVWDNSDYVTKQFERIGIIYSTALVHSGFTSFKKIAAANPRDLELVVNKQSPFGNHLRNSALHMPEYCLDVCTERSDSAVRVHVALANSEILRDRSTAGEHHTCVLLVGGRNNEVLLKAKVKDAALLASQKYERVVKLPPAATSGEISVAWISERYAGIDISRSLKPVQMSIPTMMTPRSKVPEKTSRLSNARFKGVNQNMFSQSDITPALLEELHTDWDPLEQHQDKPSVQVRVVENEIPSTPVMSKAPLSAAIQEFCQQSFKRRKIEVDSKSPYWPPLSKNIFSSSSKENEPRGSLLSYFK